VPEHDVREVAGLQVMSTPAQTLAVHGEVLGNPQDRIRQTTTLCRAELLVESSRCTRQHQLIITSPLRNIDE